MVLRSFLSLILGEGSRQGRVTQLLVSVCVLGSFGNPVFGQVSVSSRSTEFKITHQSKKYFPSGQPAREVIEYKIFRDKNTLLWPADESEFEVDKKKPQIRKFSGCLKNGQSFFELKPIQYEKIKIGWLMKIAKDCGDKVSYKFRILAVKPKSKSYFEADFKSEAEPVLREVTEGIEFWALEDFLFGDGAKRGAQFKRVSLPNLYFLKVAWSKHFEFSRKHIASLPETWPEIRQFDLKFANIFLTGIKELNPKLAGFALRSLFKDKDIAEYKSLGLPETKKEIEETLLALDRVSPLMRSVVK